MPALDARRLRRDFPILERRLHDDIPLTYLDSAASAQKPRVVLEAIDRVYRHHYANVHRGAHTLSAEATALYEGARARVARFLRAPSERSVVFVRNATEGVNLVAHAWGRRAIGEGDEILVTVAEHHANLVPWHLLAAERGARVRGVPLGSDGRPDLDALREMVGERTRLIATFHVSNVLGLAQYVAAIGRIARDAGAFFLVDGAQAAPHLPVDVGALGADAYVFSGHKVGGPSGIGVLWVREELLAQWPPFLGGGEMIRKVTVEGSTYADIPMRFEAGTPAIAEAVGLHAALDYLDDVGLEAIWEHDRALARYAIERLRGVDGVHLYGPEGDDRGGIVAFNVDGVHPHDVASALDARGIAVRAGHHCAQPLMTALGVQSTARASFWLHTTEEEIDRLVDGVVEVRDFFAVGAR
jgi:cysteine desulfurase / selenocysteine lyase